ncbi:MAG: Molybdopterin biosynthesis protein MoeA [uncultured Thiotrichaceae bacterium]|uniref:Molybdopterin molybdenumtransferase n=1 Tax=uncultured Thiotrichaceae bacterium TaxID=298394 RepID=A0A6S6TYB6_9GAMM|nr:MAG: Molybdopterin biosynthesis protein MoeA [uncultured Thiotrichaceae bacterium]
MKKTVQHDPSCADDFDPASITIDQARLNIEDDISPITGKEKIALRSALNRVLAEGIQSPIKVPAHNNSAMDGYALAGSDLPADEVKSYVVIGTAFAGKPFPSTCQPGQVVRIMTGAVIPEGCDTVVMQEHVQSSDETNIEIGEGHRTGQNVRMAGEDIAQGTTVIEAGRRLTPSDLGILASVGVAEVNVFRRPRVAFFSTGDELKSVGETLNAGDIFDSNRYSLYGMLTRMDVEILDMGVVRDDPQALRDALLMAADMADLIITSGGVSVGEADYIKTILDEIGDIRFWKIGMKPGRPLTFGKINNARFFGLPGNPVSVMVTFYQFVQPALHYLSSGKTKAPITIPAICTTSLRKRPGRFEFQRGIYEQDENGKLTVKKTGQQGSGILSSMSHANCFILLPVELTSVAEGEIVQIQPFEGFI